MAHSEFTGPAKLASGALLEMSRAGRLRVTTPDGTMHDPALVVRAFPISSPDQGFSLMSADGHELAWIEHLDTLEPAARALVQQALDEREFMPVISRLIEVSGFVTPCTWQVDTDRGPARFVLKGEEDIRRIGNGALLVSDSDGIHYLIRDVAGLDRASKKILDRFM
jgi:hypothetical protein